MRDKDISCEACGFAFRYHHRKRLHSHHIRPKGHGGDDTEANKILLCPNCHSIAHILLSMALYSAGTIDIYDLYERGWLIHQISRYHRDKPMQLIRRALKVFLYNIQIVLRIPF